MNIGEFLHGLHPFDGLDDGALARVERSVRIEFFPAGAEIIRRAGPASPSLYVVRSGAVEILDGERLIDLMGEGELFGFPSLLSGEPPSVDVRAHEDTICYAIDHGTAEEVMGSAAGLAFLASRASWRGGRPRAGPELSSALRSVGSLVGREPVVCDAGITVREAATLMAERRVSSLLVRHGPRLGIVTDRDLRTRVVAAGRGFDTPVEEVATFPARTVPPETQAGEVLLSMLDLGFHHFPIADAGGPLIGVVTDTDLMGMARQSPFALKSEIERAKDAEAVAAAGRRVPEVVCGLVEASVDPVDVGRVVAIAVDSMTSRLLRIEMDRVGEPPVPWAWLALGSAARREQALHTDQDHALAYDAVDGGEEEADAYFAELAGAVTDGLAASGIPRCDGGAMAENRSLRRSVEGWRRAFREWMADPGMKGSILTSIVFDYRRVAGSLDVESALDAEIRAAPHRPLFLRHLARRALDTRPPTGFFREFVVEAKGEHAGRLDVKHGGIMIVGNLARARAVAAGSTEKTTRGRLRAAAAAGSFDEETAEGLSEAFGLLWQERLRHQAAQVRAGEPPDDFVDPATLGQLTRSGLRTAFRIVANAQKVLDADLGLTRR